MHPRPLFKFYSSLDDDEDGDNGIEDDDDDGIEDKENCDTVWLLRRLMGGKHWGCSASTTDSLDSMALAQLPIQVKLHLIMLEDIF